jgi:hypothetical protein
MPVGGGEACACEPFYSSSNCITGYTLYNDCANAVVSSNPLTVMGDVYYGEEWRMQDAAAVFVFPFEHRLHDYGHAQILLNALLNIVDDFEFVSYTSVYLFARRTERILAVSRNMAWDAEVVLKGTRASWFNAESSPRFACSTMMQEGFEKSRRVDICNAADVCAKEETLQNGGTPGVEAQGADCVPLMVAVALGATGDCCCYERKTRKPDT